MITEQMIAEAEAAANEADSRFAVHEDACTQWTRDLTCLRCTQLSRIAFDAQTVWESLVREHARQQTAGMAR